MAADRENKWVWWRKKDEIVLQVVFIREIQRNIFFTICSSTILIRFMHQRFRRILKVIYESLMIHIFTNEC